MVKNHKKILCIFLLALSSSTFTQSFQNNSALGYDIDKFTDAVHKAVVQYCTSNPTQECVLKSPTVKIVKDTCGKISDQNNKDSCLDDANLVTKHTLENLSKDKELALQLKAAEESAAAERKVAEEASIAQRKVAEEASDQQPQLSRQESAASDEKTDCRKPKNQLEVTICCRTFGRDLNYCIEKLSNPRKSKDQQLSWEGDAYSKEMALSDFKNSKNSSTDLKGIHIGMPQVEVMNKLSLTFTRIEEPKKWKSSQLYSVYIWEDPENLSNIKLNRTAAQRKAAKRESYSLAGVRVLAITMIFINQRLALFSLQFRQENGDNSVFQTVGLPILKQKFPSSYSFERANDLTAYKKNAPFFMESESIKRLFSKFLRSRVIIPENLSDEEIDGYIKDFYKTHIGFLRLTPAGMPTDNWNEPWPYILNVEECASGVNLFGDKSNDETMGLFCVPGQGGNLPIVQLNITTETSKLALWAVRRTLTDEIAAAVKKGTEESVKKQKKDL